MKWAKDLVLTFARVPDQPHVPDGSEDSVRVFNAGRNYFIWRLIIWGIANAAIAILILIAFAFSFIPTLPRIVHAIWLTVATGAGVLLLASLPITYFLQRLNYEMRWYIVSDRSLRIRSGIVWLQELTMTFANIQGIRVNANPIERLLGLANVEVQSAGGGGGGQHATASGHLGIFAGVDNAEAIRDLLVERLRVYRDSGLGEKTIQGHDPPAVLAAHEVLEEARKLRTALAARPESA